MTSLEQIATPQKPVKALGVLDVQVRQAINRIADCDCPVLIVGERGTGKRSVAAQIHAQSPRPRGVYQDLQCCDVDAQMLTACLSKNGTLYLAEVSELDLSLQEMLVKNCLLSGQSPACRLLFGSSHELVEDLKALRIREDFYYFISAVTVRLPPLRYRKQEIIPIAEALLCQYSRQYERPQPVLCREIIDFLMAHTWPDNLFELQTAMKTLVVIGDQAISLAALKAAAPAMRGNGNRRAGSLKEATRNASIQVERLMISEVLRSNGGNRKRAADELGISYKALLYKIKQIGTETLHVPEHFGDTR
jgi:DNA-binding NtrC family response regulator